MRAALRLETARALAEGLAEGLGGRAANENTGPAGEAAASVKARRVYEAAAASQGDAPAALGFSLAAMAPRLRASKAPLMLCQTAEAAREFGRPYAPGLAAFGLAPERLVYVEAKDERQLLWITEEAVVSGGLAGVVARLPVKERLYGFTESRRLALRAQNAGTPALLVRSHYAEGSTAAAARWRIAAAPSADAGYRPPRGVPGLGPLRWQVKAERVRGGKPWRWLMEWHGEAHRLHLATAPGDEPGEGKRRFD